MRTHDWLMRKIPVHHKRNGTFFYGIAALQPTKRFQCKAREQHGCQKLMVENVAGVVSHYKGCMG